MNCQQINRYLFDYCDGNLSPSYYQGVKNHIFHCRHCQNLVIMVDRESDVLKNELDIPELSLDFTSQVLAGIKEKYGDVAPAPYLPQTTLYNSKPILYWIASALTTALLLFVLVSPQAMQFLTFKSGGSETPSNPNHTLSQMADLTDEQAANSMITDDNDLSSPNINNHATGKNKSKPGNAVVLNDSGANIDPDHQQLAEAPLRSTLTADEILNDYDQSEMVAPETDGTNDSTPFKQMASLTLDDVADELFTLTPVNIPDQYILTQISAVTENEMVYDYHTTNGQTLQLAVISPNQSTISRASTPEPAESLKTIPSFDPTLESSLDSASATGSSPATNPTAAATYSWSIAVDGIEYYLTLSGNNANLQQLAELAAAIQLEGGNMSDTSE